MRRSFNKIFNFVISDVMGLVSFNLCILELDLAIEIFDVLVNFGWIDPVLVAEFDDLVKVCSLSSVEGSNFVSDVVVSQDGC